MTLPIKIKDDMTEVMIFNEKYCKITMNKTNGTLYAKWSGFLKITDIKAGCCTMTEYSRDNNITKHLSDHLDLKALTDDCKNYLTQEWFPEVGKIGLKRIAVLVSPNIFTRSSVDSVNSAVKLEMLAIETFNTTRPLQKVTEKG